MTDSQPPPLPAPKRRRRGCMVAGLVLATSILLVLVLMAASFFWSAGRGGIPTGTRVLKDIAYVTNGHSSQKLDLYVPAKPTGPVLVYIHGGGWQGGDKAMTPAVGMLGLGYTLVSVNYRFTQDAIFPAQIEDCKAALRWVRAHAAEYGYDATRIAAMGDSAGGHLVALLAATGGTRDFDVGENLDQASSIRCGIDLYGPTDFVNFQPENDNPDIQRSGSRSLLVRLLGGSPDDRKEAAERASPVWWAREDCAPLYILHGTKDPLVPLKQSQLMEEKLKSLKVEVTLDVLEGSAHGGTAFFEKERVNRLLLFLQKWLK